MGLESKADNRPYRPELFEISAIPSGDVRSLCQDVHQHFASFMENVLLFQKKKKTEISNKHSDIVDSHSGMSFFSYHVQQTAHSSDGHN